jgi:cation-transporting ATPase E
MIGLSSTEVAERVARKQQNIGFTKKTKTIKQILIENVFSVFNLIIGIIVIFFLFFYLNTSDIRLVKDAIGVFLVGFVNTSIAVFQEIKAKISLDKVNLLLKREVTVVRDGKQLSISCEDIVVDDLIYLGRGDQVIVDGVIKHSNHLEIDESLLTGESIPVLKTHGDQILSGSFCMSGNGHFVASEVGNESYAARITKLAKKYKFSLTPLQKKINFVVKALFAVAVLLIVAEILGVGESCFQNVDCIRRLGTLLMGLVPQGLVLMASVTFAVGVLRISRIGALIQKLNAIESFSSVQVICMDKTGTLTQNKLTLHKATLVSDSIDEVTALKELGTYAHISSEKNATLRAIQFLEYDPEAEVIDEIPFSSERKMSVLTLKRKSSPDPENFVLGAFDILIDKVSKDKQSEILQIYSTQHLELYRSLLFGKIHGNLSLEDILNHSSFSLQPISIVSITDKVREDVYDTIHHLEEKGLDFKILSGDAAPAIQAVCREIGWVISVDEIVSGDQIDSSNDITFSELIHKMKVFARLKPEHKLRIIKEFRAQGYYTAMIGDGVNDLPAIKEADIGIAMEEGSQITKEIADIILLKNRFSLLPQIFNEGQKIVNTVASVAKLFLTKNFIVIYVSLFALLFNFEFPLTPRRISLINVFAIGLPCIIMALLNNSIRQPKNFLADLFTFSGISGFVIVLSGYISFYTSRHMQIPGDNISELIMLSVMVILAIVNFLIISLEEKGNSRFKFWGYGIAVIVCYFFLLFSGSERSLLGQLKEFYEIATTFGLQPLKLVLYIGVSGSVLLFILQRFRLNRIQKF